MDVGSRLRRRWYLVILAAIIALAVGASTVLKFAHGHVKVSRSVYRVAIGQVLVDTNPSTLTNITGAAKGLAGRAQLISEYATGPRIVARIASRAGVPVSSLKVQAQTTNSTKTGGSSSKDLLVGKGTESVLLRSTGQGQTITVSAQSHSAATAKALVTATISSLSVSLRRLQNAQPYNHVSASTTTSTTSTTTTASGSGSKSKSKPGKTPPKTTAAQRAAKTAAAAAAQRARSVDLSKIVLRSLGGVSVNKVIASASKSKAIGYAIGAFIVLVLLILAIDSLLPKGRRTTEIDTSASAVPATDAPTRNVPAAHAPQNGEPAEATPAGAAPPSTASDD